MSQFNLYLERVQRIENYQDLEVYDEGFKEMLIKIGAGGALMAVLLGSALGIKSHADNKAHLKDQERMTKTVKHAVGYDMNESEEKAIDSLLEKVYEKGELKSTDKEALKDFVNYTKLAPSQKENVDSVISILGKVDNYKSPEAFRKAFHAAYKLVTKNDYTPNPYIK